MRLTSAHSSPRDYVAPSSPPWWCPTIAPRKRNAFLSPRVIHSWFGRHTRASKTREGSRGAADLSRSNGYYLRTALREFILSFAYTKFEISCLQRVVQSDTRWAITTVLKRMWRNQVWKWHLVGTLYTRNRYIFNSFSNSRVNVFWKKSGFVYLIFTMHI